MKKAAWAILGAVLGYAVIALTVGWFVDGPILALAYLVGVIGGAYVMAFRPWKEEGAA